MVAKQIIVLVGPSGSGKTSIGEELAKKGIPRLITTTTRSPRKGEVDGVDYYFREFSNEDIDEFIEQTIYNDNRYGLTKAEVQTKLDRFDKVHVSLDQQGAEAVCEAFPEEAYIVFVSVTEDEMIRRMKRRGDTEEAIQERIAFSRATDELVAPDCANYEIVNHNIQESAQKIVEACTSHLSK